MTFDRFNRRTHLYLGLILLPWVLMYGVSSLIVSHQPWFRSETEPKWELLYERPYQRAIPDGSDLRDVAYDILKDNGLDGAFYHQRPNKGELRITRHTFFDQTRLTYFVDAQKLRAERLKVPGHQALVRMHFRGGFHQPSFLNQLWGVLVDLTCVAILAWVATGLIMWWRLARLRVAGTVALAAGVLSFALLIWQL